MHETDVGVGVPPTLKLLKIYLDIQNFLCINLSIYNICNMYRYKVIKQKQMLYNPLRTRVSFCNCQNTVTQKSIEFLIRYW